MKARVLLVAVIFTAATVPKAEALFLPDLFSKAKNAIEKVVQKAGKTVKNVVKGIGDKAKGFAKNALTVAGAIGKRLLTKVHDTMMNVSGHAKTWLQGKAKQLADKLPGVFQKWANKGIVWGTKAADKLQGHLDELIHKGINWTEGFVDKAFKMTAAQISKLQAMLMERAKAGLELARQVARGKVAYVQGLVNKTMAPQGIRISAWLNEQIKKPGIKPLIKPKLQIKPRPPKKLPLLPPKLPVPPLPVPES